MKQHLFEQQHAATWQMLEQQVNDANNKKSANKGHAHFVSNYRKVCHHLAQAKQRQYSPYLIDSLNRLVMSMHTELYREDVRFRNRWLSFFVEGFPKALHDNRNYVWLAAALFVLPGILMFLGCLYDDSLIYTLMDPAQVRSFEAMYNPENDTLGKLRESDTDLMMFGYYIKNNIGISFRTFASGIVFGLGSAFFLIFNGVHIGGVAGHLTSIQYTDTFFPFVAGHGSFELTAIVLSGAAGLRIGFALLSPGHLSRLVSLREAAKDAIRIIYGSTLMLLIAAFLEAFWSSSSTLAVEVKYAAGALFWLLVLGWCSLYRWRKPL